MIDWDELGAKLQRTRKEAQLGDLKSTRRNVDPPYRTPEQIAKSHSPTARERMVHELTLCPLQSVVRDLRRCEER